MDYVVCPGALHNLWGLFSVHSTLWFTHPSLANYQDPNSKIVHTKISKPSNRSLYRSKSELAGIIDMFCLFADSMSKWCIYVSLCRTQYLIKDSNQSLYLLNWYISATLFFGLWGKQTYLCCSARNWLVLLHPFPAQGPPPSLARYRNLPTGSQLLL